MKEESTKNNGFVTTCNCIYPITDNPINKQRFCAYLYFRALVS